MLYKNLEVREQWTNYQRLRQRRTGKGMDKEDLVLRREKKTESKGTRSMFGLDTVP